MQKLTLLLILITTQVLFSKQISYKVDNRVYKRDTSVHLQPNQKLKLKFNPQNIKSIKWYQIIPDSSKFYKNANHPWENNPYKWIGFGKIDYQRVEVVPFQGKSEVEIDSKILELYRPKNNKFYNTKLGSFWFQAVVVLNNGKVVQSAGLESNNHRGISTKVFRLTYQESNDYIGYLTGFFNVPGIFGAVPAQSKNYVGVDCADVLTATSAIINNIKLKEYNVAMLVNEMKTQSTLKVENGVPLKKLKWEKDFRKGDFIAVKYREDGRYAHIGLLYEDANSDGWLDKDDIIINAGPHALHTLKLSKGAFDGFVKILKNKDIGK